MEKVYIIIVNYNGWQDTVECLESILKLNYKNYQIILVDNASTNDSLSRIKAWAKGELTINWNISPELLHLSSPAVTKPVKYTEILPESIERDVSEDILTIIPSQVNEGFSAGNNLAIKYACSRADFSFVWLVNNDTVVEPDSLTYLVEKAYNFDKKIGIVGGKVMYYDQPDTFQCAGGGTYNPFLATPRPIGNNQKDEGQFDVDCIPKMYLIMGACTLASKEFIKVVGLMSENYFLYFEEQDWAERGRRSGKFELAYSYKSKIYHKSGSSTGGKSKFSWNKFADFYYSRSKIIFTKKFYPHFLITVYLSFLIVMLKRIFRGQADRVPMLFRVLLRPDKKYKSQL